MKKMDEEYGRTFELYCIYLEETQRVVYDENTMQGSGFIALDFICTYSIIVENKTLWYRNGTIFKERH